MIISQTIETKSYTALILSLFDNLELETQNGIYQIPIKYGNASRLYKKLSSKSESVSYRTPIISLIQTDDIVNLERAQNRLLKRKRIEVDGQVANITYNSTPYDMVFELTIISDTLTTLKMITEHIITKFHNNTYYVDYVSPLGETISTPIILNEINSNVEDNDSEYLENRYITGTISLTVEGAITNKFNTTSNKINLISALFEKYNNEVQELLLQYTIEG